MQSHKQKQDNQTAIKSSVTDDLVNDCGERFGEIIAWAADRDDLVYFLEISYRILGLDPYTVAIANLPYECNHSESKLILEQWSDNFLLQGLNNLTRAFYADDTIAKKYPRVTPAGNHKKLQTQFKPYAKKKFLLALITQVMPGQPETDEYIDRRRLRLWLLAQAAQRLVQHELAADQSISNAARFLVMSPSDKRWDVVDTLLKNTRETLGKSIESKSFYRYTLELGRAAANLKHDEKLTDRSRKLFLNAIISVATGECSPTEETTPKRPLRGMPKTEKKVGAVSTNDVLSADQSSPLLILDEAGGSEEEDRLYVVTEVDPTDSLEQQVLISGSVFLQTAEQAQYLPWSWDRVLPAETQALESWIEKHLTSKNLVDRMGATFVWLATNLARSLELTGRIAITQELTAEWSFSSDFSTLKRAAPRRQSSWKASGPVADLIEPFRDDLTVIVPKQIAKNLQKATQTYPDAKNLHGIWRVVCDHKIEVWFNAQARLHFPRITSAKLAVYQSQRLFNITGQPSFARLLSSHPQSALPATCSYLTWNTPSVEKRLALSVQKVPEISTHANLMGSRLSPKDDVLAAEIERATLSMDGAYRKDYIQYHNAVTQYVVTAIYAATGGRPLQDPFESAGHFSIDFQCVFIADKSDDGLHSGRVVPLPSKAVQLFKDYLQLLARLEAELTANQPGLAAQVNKLIKGQPAELPLFFLLDQNLQWHSITTASRLGCKLFDFKLPRNHFRHRYAQRLMSHGVDSEVIEGWMGHAERGAASYADYSVRCWEADAKTFKYAYEAAYDALPFRSTLQLNDLPPLLYIPISDGKDRKPKAFGHCARKVQRDLKNAEVKNSANTSIELFLAKRKLSELNDTELSTLCDQMLFREDGLPQTNAALRFNTLLEQLRELGTEGLSPESLRYKLLTKRLVRLEEEHSLIQASSIQALELYAKFQDWSEQTAKETLKGRLSKSHALCLGAALLAVEKRLSYKYMLLDICQGRNFRIIQNQRMYELEYSEKLDLENFFTPAQTHTISYKTASLLAHGLHEQKSVTVPDPANIKGLKPLVELQVQHCNALSTVQSMERFVHWLCGVISQANLLQLPGLVAAALDGRTLPTSLSLHDRIRVQHGQALELGTKKPTKALELVPVSTRVHDRSSSKSSLQESAEKLDSEIYLELNSYQEKNAKIYARRINKIAKSYRHKVSSSLQLAAYWIVERIKNGTGRNNTFEPYAQRSLLTYWSTISSAFRGHLYEIDLVALDSDEVTELCSKILTYKWQQQQDATYLGDRLVEFFRWAAHSGVATPAWAELNLDCKDRTVSPGFITESEYLLCQETLKNNTELPGEHQTLFGFVLLLGYRFGLRLSEATGLLRRDWCTDAGLIYVLVQANQYRGLKSDASRRAVPLLFALTEAEEELIKNVLMRYTSYAGQDESRPILCAPSSEDDRRLVLAEEVVDKASPTLIQLIRKITHNHHHVFHHTRHSFYNRVAPAIFGFETAFSKEISTKEEYENIRRIVFGPINVHSRRSGMAMARLMGHAFVKTGLKSYFHLATDWADALTPIAHQRARKLAKAIQVSEFSSIIDTKDKVIKVYQYPTPTFESILKVLRLASLGVSYERAGEVFELQPKYSRLLEQNITLATSAIRFTSEQSSSIKIKGANIPKALLESITGSGWIRFFKVAEELDRKNNYINEARQFHSLDEVVSFIGADRHILMEQKEHSDFVKLVLEKFSISEERYKVFVSSKSILAAEHLKSSGFQVESYTNRNLNSFKMFVPQRNSHYRVEDYGGLILDQSPTGTVRNRNDLALVLLAYSSYLQIVKMEQ